jgi:hypothetical protein
MADRGEEAPYAATVGCRSSPIAHPNGTTDANELMATNKKTRAGWGFIIDWAYLSHSYVALPGIQNR